MYSVTTKTELEEILEFTHFYEHFTFDKTDWSDRGKRFKKYIKVIVAVELDTVATRMSRIYLFLTLNIRILMVIKNLYLNLKMNQR